MFMGPTWGPPGSCRPQVGSTLAPWTLLSGYSLHHFIGRVMMDSEAAFHAHSLSVNQLYVISDSPAILQSHISGFKPALGDPLHHQRLSLARHFHGLLAQPYQQAFACRECFANGLSEAFAKWWKSATATRAHTVLHSVQVYSPKFIFRSTSHTAGNTSQLEATLLLPRTVQKPYVL